MSARERREERFPEERRSDKILEGALIFLAFYIFMIVMEFFFGIFNDAHLSEWEITLCSALITFFVMNAGRDEQFESEAMTRLLRMLAVIAMTMGLLCAALWAESDLLKWYKEIVYFGGLLPIAQMRIQLGKNVMLLLSCLSVTTIFSVLFLDVLKGWRKEN